MLTTSRKIAGTLLAVSLLATACSGGDAEDTDTTDDAAAEETTDDAAAEGGGTVLLDGSSTVGPLSEVAAESFMNENPDIRVTVAISGTGGGFEKFCNGETDGNNSSRPIKDDEAERCEENGIGFDFVTVANDALSVLVNPEFPLDCMTADQIEQIWTAGSDVSVWGDVEGADFPDDFASNPVQLYGAGTDSGTFDYFTEAINGESGVIRNDYIDIGEDDQAGVVAVSGDPAAMSFTPFSFTEEAGDSVKPLQIDDGNGCVEATIENVQNKSYTPLGRELFVYFSDTALSRPEVLDFAEYYINNAPELAEIAEYVPLTDEQVQQALDKVDALVNG